MFKIFYTTHMSASARQLQARFIKMRAGTGAFSRRTAAAAAMALTAAAMFATIAFASIDGLDIKNGTLVVDGKNQGIDIIYIESQKATHTDSFYVPLRETFESLGFTVHYDVDKSKYADRMGDVDFPSYSWGEELVKTETDKYMYGATERMNANMPIIEMVSPAGITEYCQLGSKEYSNGYTFTPPALIDGRAYLPIRAVANIIGGTNNVKWNDGAHDTYYKGAVTFDEDTMTVTVNTDWTKPTAIDDYESRALYDNYEDMTTACYDVTERFFTAFANGDAAAARVCGTAEFLESQFNNDMLFYEPRAELVTVRAINMYTDGNIYVDAEISDDYTERDVLIRMAAQPDGTFLIDDVEAVDTRIHDVPVNYVDESNTVMWSAEE